MADKTWKQRERDIAEYFGTVRNPLSGKNNVGDDGSPREGDIIYPYALIEVKLRKTNSTIKRAKATKKEAEEKNKPFMHIETMKGDKKVIALCVSEEVAKYLINKFKEKCEKPE